MKTKLLTLISSLFFTNFAFAQLGISPTNTPPHASAMLDVSSTNKGLLIPRMTTAQRIAIASPANGLTVYDTNTLGFWFYNGTAWQNLLTVGNNLWLANGSDIYNNNTGNIGIGIQTPQSNLHIFRTNANAILTTETGTGGFLSGQLLKSPGGVFNQLEIHKWGPGSSGTQAGIPLDNLSKVVAGVDAGALMLGTVSNNPIHFISNNLERMRLYANGIISINTLSSTARVNVVENDPFKPALIVSHENAGSGDAIQGRIFSPFGVAVSGLAFNGPLGAVSPYEANSYGILGSVGDVGVGVGAFSYAGTALRSSASTGLALHTTGRLKLQGIGHGAGRILTSDANGEATWQDASASSGWSKNMDADIYNNPSNAVIIGTNIKHPSLSFYNDPIGLQVYEKKSTFYDNTGGDVTLKIINGGSFTDEPIEAGTAFYIKSPLGTAVNIDTRYTGIEAVSTAQNNLWSVGRFTLNNLTSTANAFEISNNGLGYALTVNNLGAGSNASSYFSNSNNTYTTSSNIGVELNNSYLKVSGVARTMFTVTTTVPTITANRVLINYPGMAQTDMLVVTHVYTNAYLGGIGVWWDGAAWTIFRQDQLAMPVGQTFNVMVVKQ